MNAFFSKLINYLNGNPYFVSFQVHCWIMCTLIYHLGKVLPVLPLAVIMTAVTAWKEFYWDHVNEPDHNAWPQGAVDFGSYLTGTVLALIFTYTGT